jgi:hypothetical protein
VDKLYVNITGQVVRKGERLLEIYSPELVSAEEEYIIALKRAGRRIPRLAAPAISSSALIES